MPQSTLTAGDGSMGDSETFSVVHAATLAGFSVDSVASPKTAGVAFTVVVTAYDAFGNIKTNHGSWVAQRPGELAGLPSARLLARDRGGSGQPRDIRVERRRRHQQHCRRAQLAGRGDGDDVRLGHHGHVQPLHRESGRPPRSSCSRTPRFPSTGVHSIRSSASRSIASASHRVPAPTRAASRPLRRGRRSSRSMRSATA